MENKENTKENILKALAEIRPYLINDGGDVSLVAIDKDVVSIKFEGACIDCAVNRMTLKSGIEMTIKKYAPNIKEVIDIGAKKTK
jgi:Fe-S cluster biogenesis protein NfuA